MRENMSKSKTKKKASVRQKKEVKKADVDFMDDEANCLTWGLSGLLIGLTFLVVMESQILQYPAVYGVHNFWEYVFLNLFILFGSAVIAVIGGSVVLGIVIVVLGIVIVVKEFCKWAWAHWRGILITVGLIGGFLLLKYLLWMSFGVHNVTP
jgi:hypothetical protein